MSRREPSRTHHGYLAANGHRRPLPDLFTLVRTDTAQPARPLDPPQERLLIVLEKGSLTLVDAASYLSLPLSAMRVVVSGLIDASLVETVEPAHRTDPDLLKRVLRGLRDLLPDDGPHAEAS
ncbi:DUF742 domain-containing protein [Streptomyces sp. NPDC101062]|uniref:DUF742 domain-containing protein n=1 Tax=unclassified Streptomyces TaxID=2593676 RepID=UPI002E775430|nr:DUF742 domain-containing protein [Streptomyces sp. JV176]MEE1798113.1 DUF742 domain-containing protein [Streptomyces sp. JV176]